MNIETIIKSNTFEYGFSKEVELLIKINISLKSNLNLIKTTDKYCCVDYELHDNTFENTSKKVNQTEFAPVSASDNLILYIELKSRRNISKFNTLIIGQTKLWNISKYTKKTILLWIDDVDYYYCFFDKKFLNYKYVWCNGKRVLPIPKTEITLGTFETFMELLNASQDATLVAV